LKTGLENAEKQTRELSLDVTNLKQRISELEKDKQQLVDEKEDLESRLKQTQEELTEREESSSSLPALLNADTSTDSRQYVLTELMQKYEQKERELRQERSANRQLNAYLNQILEEVQQKVNIIQILSGVYFVNRLHRHRSYKSKEKSMIAP